MEIRDFFVYTTLTMYSIQIARCDCGVLEFFTPLPQFALFLVRSTWELFIREGGLTN